MNADKVQKIINQVIEENRNRIGAKATRKQYKPGKAQIEMLTRLGIIELMPLGFGFSDADVVIAAASEKATTVFNIYGEGEAVASSSLYDAINEKEIVSEENIIPSENTSIEKGSKVRVKPHTAYQHLKDGAVINPMIAHEQDGYETTVRAIYSEKMEDEHGKEIIEISIEVATGEIFNSEQLEVIH